MKKLRLFILIAICTLFVKAHAQSCYSYMPENVGDKWTITNYSAKGKVEGVSKFELLDKSTTANKVTYEVKGIGYDTKGKETFSMTYDAICENGKFTVISLCLKLTNKQILI